MKYEIIFPKKAQKQLLSLPKNIRTQILEKLTFFGRQENPLSFTKKLQGHTGRYRLRSGSYRIIFQKENEHELVLLLILDIKHRKDSYK